MKKILICGGHPTPALAVAEELQKNPDVTVLFVGRKYAIESERTLSYEYKMCAEKRIPFRQLNAGRATRLLTKSSFLSMLRVPFGFIHALIIVLQEKPSVVMSFGGYIALPLTFWAWVAQIPVYTHEQTISSGIANKYIGFFSRKIFTAFEQSMSQFPPHKTQWVGNPVRRIVFEHNKLSFPYDANTPMLYITGGSLGSHSINEHVFGLTPRLVEQFTVVHQVGEIKEYGDFEKANMLKQKLAREFPHRYIPVSHISEHDLGMVYRLTEFVVGRAGANTFFELIALKKPALFIPLPWSANGEQRAHADLFKSYGIGEVIDQKEDGEKLYELIQHMHSHLNSYQDQFIHLPLELKHDATQTITSALLHS